MEWGCDMCGWRCGLCWNLHHIGYKAVFLCVLSFLLPHPQPFSLYSTIFLLRTFFCLILAELFVDLARIMMWIVKMQDSFFWKKKRKKKGLKMSTATFWCLFQSSGGCHLRDLKIRVTEWMTDWLTDKLSCNPLVYARWALIMVQLASGVSVCVHQIFYATSEDHFWCLCEDYHH